ncbi:10541_t:CDS:2, partial [Gigaspora margarita]
MLVNQKNEIDSMVASERIYFPVFAHNSQFYMNVRGKVSSFALKKINEEYKKAFRAIAQNPLPPCSEGLTLEDIHIHWWIQERLPIPQLEENVNMLQPLLQNLEQSYNEWLEHQQAVARETLNDMINSPSIALQNPNIVYTKGCPTGATNKQSSNSTRRDLSGFELVEQNVRQCSLCRQPGHNA